MRIIQLTDPHVVAAGTIWKDQLDTPARLTEAVAAANMLKPDLVVVTGDLTDDGPGPDGEAQYQAAAAALSALTAPLRLLPGNHDDRDRMRAAFPSVEWDAPPFLTFTQDFDGLNVIGLDTIIPNQTAGMLCEDRLSRLRGQLDDRPTLIFAHHPPGVLGLSFMDTIGLQQPEGLAAAIQGHNVLRIACGHVHIEAQAHWAGALVSAPPPVSATLPIAPTPGAPITFTTEPLRLAVYDWRDGVLSVKTVAA
ncbi:MAG: metallophosphoesterase [Rhodobacteraceae bacterium]|nr:metallophosphoesterase [Paracoccaceae bacterium]